MMMVGATSYAGSLSEAFKMAIEAGNDIILSSTTAKLNEGLWSKNLDKMSTDETFYNRVKDPARRVIKAKLDYKEWGKSVNDTLNKVINELKEENSSFEMISSIKKNLIDDLPDEFSLGYSLTFDENNIISNITYDMVAIGSLENIFISLSKLFPELTNAIIKYDIEVSYNLTFAFKEEAIEIPTI